MRIKLVGNKRDEIITVIRNGETSASIPRGTPVVLALDKTDDGLKVVLPATAGAQKSNIYQYGVATANIDSTDYGESMVFGFCEFALIKTLTRSATSAVWGTAASVAGNIPLQIDTAANAFVTQASQAGSNFIPGAVLIDDIPAQASSATNATDTRTAVTMGLRAFVRML
ncbi:MAG: hypothetical protein ACREHG_06835 [Candidatus Saccharimonadales bacterium]